MVSNLILLLTLQHSGMANTKIKYTLLMHSVYVVYKHYIRSICTMNTHYKRRVYIVYTQCIRSVYAMYTHYIRSVCIVYTQCICNVYASQSWLPCSDCELESRCKHGCSSLSCCLLPRSSLCDELITHSEEFYCVSVCVCMCVCVCVCV
jgi:hypothetical protein